MYSNERNSGFSVLDLLVKIIFAALFIFILVWLFQKKVPNMAPFYSNVFRENIKYMQEAGEAYFTDEKMPQEVGGTSKITLSEMFDKKLILPFVDEDGNSCNQYDSYVSITKTELGYELKTNLVCNNESDYTIKILGCHTYCETGNCIPTEKKCTTEEITKFQYKKLVSKTSTKYSCPSGYKRSGKYCYKTVVVDTESAEKTKVSKKTLTMTAKLVVEEGTKTRLSTIKTELADSTKKVYVDAIKTTTSGSTTTEKEAYSCTKTKTEKEAYTCTKTKTEKVAYDCTKTKTEKQCTTTNKKEYYSCNCTTKYVGGVLKETCDTCYKTVPVQTCKDVQKEYTDTCYREEQKTYNDTCYRDKEVKYTDTCYRDKEVTTPGKTTYSCPAIATHSTGSGSSLKCYYYETVDNGYAYSCPSNANYSTGSGSNLKCYKVTSGDYYYTCSDKSYTLGSDNVCRKTVYGSYTEYECDKGYELDGKVCKKYDTKKIKATAKKTTSKSYTYKWSTKSSLSGWTKTGKIKIVEGETKCN